jgi:hypothetical protein
LAVTPELRSILKIFPLLPDHCRLPFENTEVEILD